MYFVSTWPGASESGKPTLKRGGGSIRMFGNMKRAVPNSHIMCVAASDEKPIASDEPNSTPAAADRNERRVVPSAAGATAGRGLAYSGLGGIGGTSSFFLAAGSVGLASAAASALVIGAGFAVLAAAARVLAVFFG